jgi:GINS complex subunit 3
METLEAQYVNVLRTSGMNTRSNDGMQIKEGTKLELPLWLAEMLAVSQTQAGTSTLSLDLPHSLSPRVLNALKADPRTLDLRALAPHFYALGARMLELFEEDEVSEVLTDVSCISNTVTCMH